MVRGFNHLRTFYYKDCLACHEHAMFVAKTRAHVILRDIGTLCFPISRLPTVFKCDVLCVHECLEIKIQCENHLFVVR